MTKYRDVLSCQPARMPWIDRCVKNALTAVFPQYCLICEKPSELGICDACALELPSPVEQCDRCAVGVNRPGTCGQCQLRPPAFDVTLAPFTYTTPISGLIHRLKYGGKDILSVPLSKRLCREITPLIRHHPELIIPIPLHWTRLMRRGFNQSIELAKTLSKELQIPLDRSTVVRHQRTSTQAKLPLKVRQRNVCRAFSLRGDLAVKSIALVDDVMTSGETVNAVSKLLKQYGVEHIQVWVLSRT